MAMSWVKLNPGKALNNSIQYGAIALAVGVAGFLWWDYQDAKSDRAELRQQLEMSQQLTADQQDAISEFVEAEARQRRLVREVEELKGDLVEELKTLREGLTADAIRKAAEEDAKSATDTVVDHVNRNFELFDNATDTRPTDTDAE